MIVILKLISRLPLAVLYMISNFLFVLMYYLIGYRKKVILNNLRNSFPDKSEDEIQLIAKKFYGRFADYIVETLKAITITKEELTRRMKVLNPEVVDPYLNKGQSGVFMVSHQFNWEWVILTSSVVLPAQIDGIYKKLSHPKMDKLVLDSRSRFGAHLMEKDRSLRDIVKRKDILRLIGIVADQLPILHSKAEKYWTTFLNQETAFYAGGERISKMIKAPVFFIDVHRPRRGYYELEFKVIAEPPYDKSGHEILDSYVKATEKLIQREPEGWLWSHKRWKYTKQDDENK